MTATKGPTGPVLLTGASGLLGQWLLATRPADIEVVALTHRRSVDGVRSVTADLRDRDAVLEAFGSVRPAFVIHAAYDRDASSIVDATRHVADAATEQGCGVLYTSTDALFDGDGLERDERSEPDAGWDYGKWKGEAERIVTERVAGSTVVRLPLLVSIEPDDPAVAKIRAAAADGDSTTWYSDEYRRPALASEVAAALWRIFSLPGTERSGVWHLAGAERLSRYELAARVAAVLGLPPGCVGSESRPPESDRPCDIAFTDGRAREAIAWDPAPIG